MQHCQLFGGGALDDLHNLEEQQQQWCEAVCVRAAWLTFACAALPVV